jgi:hypothetical protein
MPIDIHTEQLHTLSQASRLLPKLNGKHPSPNAIWRWCRKGVGGVHLEHVRVGGRLFTSAEALKRFANLVAQRDVERLRDRATPPSPIPNRRQRGGRHVPTSDEVARRHAEIAAELDREGL